MSRRKFWISVAAPVFITITAVALVLDSRQIPHSSFHE
jgi:hypothetical protein